MKKTTTGNPPGRVGCSWGVCHERCNRTWTVSHTLIILENVQENKCFNNSRKIRILTNYTYT